MGKYKFICWKGFKLILSDSNEISFRLDYYTDRRKKLMIYQKKYSQKPTIMKKKKKSEISIIDIFVLIFIFCASNYVSASSRPKYQHRRSLLDNNDVGRTPPMGYVCNFSINLLWLMQVLIFVWVSLHLFDLPPRKLKFDFL